MSKRRIHIPQPGGLSLAPEKVSKRRVPGACKRLCAGGNQCDCDSRYAHQMHICHRPDCPCHIVPRVISRTVTL